MKTLNSDSRLTPKEMEKIKERIAEQKRDRILPLDDFEKDLSDFPYDDFPKDSSDFPYDDFEGID